MLGDEGMYADSDTRIRREKTKADGLGDLQAEFPEFLRIPPSLTETSDRAIRLDGRGGTQSNRICLNIAEMRRKTIFGAKRRNRRACETRCEIEKDYLGISSDEKLISLSP
jgi:hypothetical protein